MYTCNNIVLQFLVLLASLSAVLGSPFRHGYHHGPIIAYAHPKCTKTLEKVTKELCRIELEKSCTTETKTFTKITGFEKGDCKEIEVCKHGHGECIFSLVCIRNNKILLQGFPIHHGYHGKRSASPGYIVPKCEKVTKEICKKVPVKEEVSKDIDLCTRTPKKVINI